MKKIHTHAALLVGYDTDDKGRKYWKMKNSPCNLPFPALHRQKRGGKKTNPEEEREKTREKQTLGCHVIDDILIRRIASPRQGAFGTGRRSPVIGFDSPAQFAADPWFGSSRRSATVAPFFLSIRLRDTKRFADGRPC